MNRRGFLTALAALPVAGLVGMGVMKRRMTAAQMAEALQRLIAYQVKQVMFYGSGVTKIHWDPIDDVVTAENVPSERWLKAIRENTKVVPLGRLGNP